VSIMARCRLSLLVRRIRLTLLVLAATSLMIELSHRHAAHGACQLSTGAHHAPYIISVLAPLYMALKLNYYQSQIPGSYEPSYGTRCTVLPRYLPRYHCTRLLFVGLHVSAISQ